ncbi:hypothetical protein WME98_00090 [Sorangium sp. So ce296]
MDDEREAAPGAIGHRVVEIERAERGVPLAGRERRAQDRGLEPALAVRREQRRLDARLVLAILRHRAVRLVVGRRRARERAAVDAHGRADDQVARAARERPEQRVGVLRGEGDHVDHGVERALLHLALELGVFPAIAGDDLDVPLEPPRRHAAVVEGDAIAPLEELLHDGRRDEAGAADDEDPHDYPSAFRPAPAAGSSSQRMAVTPRG